MENRTAAPRGKGLRATAALIGLLVPFTAGGCAVGDAIGGVVGGAADAPAKSRTTAPPPPPIPALTQAEAKIALALYAKRSNAVHRRLDPRLASSVYTGSSLQMEIAKYRVFKANRVKIQQSRYGQTLAAAPLFSAHPKWFFAAMTDRGDSPAVRDLVVLVQDRAGGPWRAAYTPLSTRKVTGALAPGVDVADNPAVVPAADSSLGTAPGQVSAAIADVLNQGSRSPHLRSFVLPDWAKERYRALREDRKVFRRNGWTGTAAYAASRAPVYAVRTKSGGALVWTAVELREDFRHTGRGNGITWEHDSWGDLLKPTTGRSKVNRALTTVERLELAAYVPPKGRGRIQFLATRWAPISITGR
ncbi:hypothetical protein GCM10023085_53530 [Actinomadura viridis]|uniref:DUF8094 domain-containing protein n=1 Tax=Actinomadura viridis TaxID=58110 RepID=A0A931DGI6_9ACTN|nr:hypothetical protein [Actinomadura viridis]MBG6086318.1 hypothetical protein [Actinomadura viridis]